MMNRRIFLQHAVAGSAALTSFRRASARATTDLKLIQAEIEKRHEESLHRLQQWIRRKRLTIPGLEIKSEQRTSEWE